MKIDPRRADAFLRAPGDTRLALLYGEDEGLIRHRAAALTQAVVGSGDDPFRVAWLSRDDHARLEEEATALSLMGGSRVVRLRDATDTLAPRLAAVLPKASALIIVEAGGLQARSKLRVLAEASPQAAAIACYPEDAAALGAVIRAALAQDRITADADALEWLSANLGADREATRTELEKLVLFCGPGGRLSIDDARQCVGEQSALSIEDAAIAASSGQAERADACLAMAFSEGAAPVQVLRVVLGHVLRLHRARAGMGPGTTPAQAVQAMRPPVFFKHTAIFATALGRWTEPGLAAALTALRAAELACKSTGAADIALARHAVMALATRGLPARSQLARSQATPSQSGPSQSGPPRARW